jgi:hypothetical protein
MVPAKALRGVLAVALLSLLAACAAYQLVPSGKATVRNALAVEPGQSWSRVNFQVSPGPLEMWTLNGPAIDSITFYMPVADGEALQKQPGSSNEPFPSFRSSMSPSEIVELYEATLRRSTGSALVEIRNLQPTRFAAGDGFRADTLHVGQDRVRRKGVLIGTVKDKQLYLVHFQAPELHYYDRDVAEVEHVIASARIL